MEYQHLVGDTDEVPAFAVGRLDPQETTRVEFGDGVIVIRMPGRGQGKKHIVGEDRAGDGENPTQDQTVPGSSFHGRRISGTSMHAHQGSCISSTAIRMEV